MFEKRFIYRLLENSTRENENLNALSTSETLDQEEQSPEISQISENTHNETMQILGNDYEENFKTNVPNQEPSDAINSQEKNIESNSLDNKVQNESIQANFEGNNTQNDAKQDNSEGDKTVEQTEAQAINKETQKEDSNESSGKPKTPELTAELTKINLDKSEIEKRTKLNDLEKLLALNIQTRTEKLNENKEKQVLVRQNQLRDLFTSYRVRNSSGEIKYPFKGLKVSEFLANSPSELVSKLSALKEFPRYLIIAKLKLNNLEGLNIDKEKLKNANSSLNSFENSKGKKELDSQVFQASLENEKRLLDYKKQIGEMSGMEYRREFKKLLEKSQELSDNGIKINFSQNAFLSSMLASPSLTYLGNKKENAKALIVNKWKTFWKTRQLRRGMLFSGLKNALLFPPRYALKVPAYLAGYNFFRNRIRKKRGLTPITISSDLRKDFAKWGKGFEKYKNAPDLAKKELEQKKAYLGFDKVFKDSEQQIKANIEKGLPPPATVNDELFNSL